jgi:hypothetical protein
MRDNWSRVWVLSCIERLRERKGNAFEVRAGACVSGSFGSSAAGVGRSFKSMGFWLCLLFGALFCLFVHPLSFLRVCLWFVGLWAL